MPDTCISNLTSLLLHRFTITNTMGINNSMIQLGRNKLSYNLQLLFPLGLRVLKATSSGSSFSPQALAPSQQPETYMVG